MDLLRIALILVGLLGAALAFYGLMLALVNFVQRRIDREREMDRIRNRP